MNYMPEKVHISIVSPVYRSENIVPELVKQIKNTVLNITDDYEIILVNDGSLDNSWQKITEECQKDKRVKGLNLSRNFGQHYAITAGLNYASGEWIVVMDCDLQDRPDEIFNLYQKAQEGYDSVFAQRTVRMDSVINKIVSKIFYLFFSYLTDTKQDASIANFGIYNKKVIQAILSMKDQIRFFPTMVQWVGFKKYYLPVKHSKRFEGESTYDFKRLLQLAMNSVLAFSDKPLRLTVKLGFFITTLSLVTIIVYFFMYLTGSIKVLGFTSLILSFWFLSGVIIFILGFLGLYIGKIFEKVKERPSFIVNEILNIEE
ncbi:glycosyltransferase family 2 protein [uncultured Desulfobacter sp.]|uniref:glycosyltransferase family 2 protein n=1 Tax=uncultured Desulfobacter sp. TaxID=240139 RepID=UPI002AABD9C5|nr:glycosyltransferase family 2 protein [uncultured Desulfobacter sp.]